MSSDAEDAPARRVLVAGIGNIFLGDDGFGVEVVARLARRPQAPGVEIADFGIRGYDLASALLDDYAAALLVDALPQGREPGSLAVLEPDLSRLEEPGLVDGHSLHPVEVLRLVHQLGGTPARVLVVGCEPAAFGEEDEGMMGLSPRVEAAIDEAVAMVESLAGRLARGEEVG